MSHIWLFFPRRKPGLRRAHRVKCPVYRAQQCRARSEGAQLCLVSVRRTFACGAPWRASWKKAG